MGERWAQQRVVASEEGEHLVAQRVTPEDRIIIAAHVLRERSVQNLGDGRIEQVTPRLEDRPEPPAPA
jgi:hypothetical protein